jgi:hypothetical protein
MGAAAAAAIGAALATSAAQAQPKQKQYKDNAEYDVYNAVAKDIGANNFAQAITDLDTWKQKYAESDYKDDRALLYVRAYSGANQPGKALDVAGELLSKDVDTAFAPQDAIALLYTASSAIMRTPNPTPAQLEIGAKAARALVAYDKMPPGMAAPAWQQARGDLQRIGNAALLFIAILPGEQAMMKQPPDCAIAEPVFVKALSQFPDKSLISYELGRALSCQKDKPEKLMQALYEFERAAVIDPTLGEPKNDPKKIQTFADNTYIKIHGSDEGLAQLKEQVKQSPLPPAGFSVKTATEIATEKQAEFEKSNPQLALWMKIKGALADTNGDQYFETQLKNAAVPPLKGMLVEARPACRPKELLVAIPLPDAQGAPRAEITLKLDKPLTGKPEPNSEFHWEGVPSGFNKDQFMLTMDTESAKVEGLASTPCAGAAPAKKSVPKKK